jgi:hypothetical protein
MAVPEWREEQNGSFVTETGRFRLMVLRARDRQYVRFLVWARKPTYADVLIGSGTAPNIEHGIKAAERMASLRQITDATKHENRRSAQLRQ